LNDEVLREVRRRLLAALFPPKPDEVFLITAHDDARIGSPDEVSPVIWVETNDLMRCRNTVLFTLHGSLLFSRRSIAALPEARARAG
jgi:hypothetical protein